MTSVNLQTLSDDALTDHLAAWFNQTLPLAEQRRLLVAALRELAGGQPVDPQRLAALAGVGVEQAVALLRQAAAEWDQSGTRLVGFGLTSTPTRHRFQVHGHPLWTWCAVDALLFPVLIGAPAQTTSPCAATGDLVRIKATPTGVERVDPAGAVVSIVTPAVDLAEVRQAVCAAQNLYRDADAAAAWQAAHPQALLLPVAKGFGLFRRAALRVWPELRAA
jgi:alkylmercury lyase